MVSPEGYWKSLRLIAGWEIPSLGDQSEWILPVLSADWKQKSEDRGEAIAKISTHWQVLSSRCFPLWSEKAEVAVPLHLQFQTKYGCWSIRFIPFFPGRLCIHSLERQQKQREAAEVMKLTAADLCEMGMIEHVIPETEPVSRENMEDVAGCLENGIADFLEKYSGKEPEELLEHRYQRFRRKCKVKIQWKKNYIYVTMSFINREPGRFFDSGETGEGQEWIIGEVINDVLVHLFNEILRLEEEAIITDKYKDISNNDMHIIEAVGLGGGNMSSIAAKLNITVGSLTTSMNSLVKKGYVKRERSEKDRRVVFIQLTNKGTYGIPPSCEISQTDDRSVLAELNEDGLLSNPLYKKHWTDCVSFSESITNNKEDKIKTYTNKSIRNGIER